MGWKPTYATDGASVENWTFVPGYEAPWDTAKTFADIPDAYRGQALERITRNYWGSDPQQILQQIVEAGIPAEQAVEKLYKEYRMNPDFANGALSPAEIKQLAGVQETPESIAQNREWIKNDAAMKSKDTGFGEGALIASGLMAFVTAGLSAAASSGGLFSSAPGYWGATEAGTSAIAGAGADASWGVTSGGNAANQAAIEGLSQAEKIAYVKDASDGVEALTRMAELGGNAGASAGAQALGFSSADAALSSIVPQFASAAIGAGAGLTAAQTAAKVVADKATAAGQAVPPWAAQLIAGIAGPVIAGAIGSAITGGGASGGGGSSGSANTDRLIGLQGDAAAQQMKITDQQLKVYNEEVLPLIRSEVTRANNPDRINQAVATAAGDMKAQYAGAKANAARATELSGRVADPIYQSEQNKFAAAESGDVAQAITQARTQEAERARQERIQAISLYQNPVGTASAAAGSAGALYGGAANTAMTGSRLAADTSVRAGYAAAQTLGPAITKGINTWFGTPEAKPTPAYENYGGAPYDTSSTPAGYPDYSADMGYRANGGAIRRGYAEGGPVEGPGTGTSDSISTAKAPGTFILSADTVRAIGTKKITDMMEKAGVRPGDGESPDPGGRAVRLSSGEWAIPPAATAYYGEAFLNNIQKKFHRPVMDEAGGAANGGAIRVRAMPRSVEEAILGHHSPQRAIRRA